MLHYWLFSFFLMLFSSAPSLKLELTFSPCSRSLSAVRCEPRCDTYGRFCVIDSTWRNTRWVPAQRLVAPPPGTLWRLTLTLCAFCICVQVQMFFNNESLPDHMTMKRLWLSHWFGKVRKWRFVCLFVCLCWLSSSLCTRDTCLLSPAPSRLSR